MGGVGGGGYGCALGNALGSVVGWQFFLGKDLGVGVVNAWYRGRGTSRVRGVL